MPVFFFDCFDGERHHADLFGTDLASEAEVPDQATALVIALVGEARSGSASRTASVEVRDAGDHKVYAAHVEAVGHWIAPRAA